MKSIKYLPLTFFVAFCLKALIIHPSIEECAIVLALSAMSYGFEFFTEKKTIETCYKDIKTLSEKIDVYSARLDDARNQIASIKLNSGIRTQRMG